MPGKRKRELGLKDLQKALSNVDKAVALALETLGEWSEGMREEKNMLREAVRQGLKIKNRILALVAKEERKERRRG